MAQKLIITDSRYLEPILDYCSLHKIAVLQGRSYRDHNQILAWIIYCDPGRHLDFLLIKYGDSLSLA